ncbi:hypothetical protein NDU88_010726 [Pleurodeles waltl]|uniref:Uncharacterized protein n=1 Tax=Pleurodeles waltl TaxID=8319 RepID=A0AAV7PW27_PLEWA|nr:hypothetical protein NDU88_010726 [Pleurodeles waltl]
MLDSSGGRETRRQEIGRVPGRDNPLKAGARHRDRPAWGDRWPTRRWRVQLPIEEQEVDGKRLEQETVVRRKSYEATSREERCLWG